MFNLMSTSFCRNKRGAGCNAYKIPVSGTKGPGLILDPSAITVMVQSNSNKQLLEVNLY